MENGEGKQNTVQPNKAVCMYSPFHNIWQVEDAEKRNIKSAELNTTLAYTDL